MPLDRKVACSLTSWRNGASRLICLVLLFMGVSKVPLALASSAVVGSVTRSKDASVSGQTLLPNTTIFSGDSLEVKDGVAVVVVGNNCRLILSRNTTATFLKDTNEITVTLNQGNVSAYYSLEGTPLRVKAGEVSITAAPGPKAVGEVTMGDGSIVITAKEGTLQVEDQGAVQNLPQGQTMVTGPKTKKRGAMTAIIAAGGVGAAAAIVAGLELNKAQFAATCVPTPSPASPVSPTAPCP